MNHAIRPDPPSERTALAAGLFARLADAIDRGRFAEARDARERLAALGFLVRLRFPRAGGRKGVTR